MAYLVIVDGEDRAVTDAEFMRDAGLFCLGIFVLLILFAWVIRSFGKKRDR